MKPTNNDAQKVHDQYVQVGITSRTKHIQSVLSECQYYLNVHGLIKHKLIRNTLLLDQGLLFYSSWSLSRERQMHRRPCRKINKWRGVSVTIPSTLPAYNRAPTTGYIGLHILVHRVVVVLPLLYTGGRTWILLLLYTAVIMFFLCASLV